MHLICDTMKYGLSFLMLVLSTGQTFSQIRSADLTGIWVIKKSATITVSGGHVFRDEGLYMLDTLKFFNEGNYEFMLAPAQGSLGQRMESGVWSVKNDKLVLNGRHNQVGQQLPREQMAIKLKGKKKLRLYFNIGGAAQEHYEQYVKLKSGD